MMRVTVVVVESGGGGEGNNRYEYQPKGMVL